MNRRLRPTRRGRSHSLTALVLLATIALAACSGEKEAPAGAARGGPLKFPVEVAPVEAAPVEYSVQSVGSVEAFEQVAVTARVAGAVERVRFQEGDQVGPTDVLAEIDPDRFRLAEAAAKAELDKAVAARDEAQLGLERRRLVNEKNPDLVRAEEVDQWRTRLASAEGEVARTDAALGLARLNRRDAFVRAPAAGVIQTREVETGQYVQPGAQIATLVRREPLLLRFRVPETEAAPLAPGMAARFTLRGGRDRSYTARLTLVAAAANARDRMVDVTAQIDDPNRDELRPGAFAEVVVPVAGAASEPVIPQTAIRPSERGFLAYVVEDGVARERVLQLGLRTADGRVEVRSGLEQGEQLVVRGAEPLADGAAVSVAPAGSTNATPTANEVSK
jgi:multidrug efflux system membrane fusion protein